VQKHSASASCSPKSISSWAWTAAPWGRDENGNHYYWLTEGVPAEWVVVQNSARGTGCAQHECSMTEFLVGILEGRIEPLASGYPSPEVFVFYPYPRLERPWWRIWG
jgi:hypothetical protein